MYITNYNLSKIIPDNGDDFINKIDLGGAYQKGMNKIFSIHEFATLSARKSFFDNHREFNIKNLRSIVINDNLKYVFPPIQPAYHKDNQCKRLKSDWNNYIIPNVIRKQGSEAISKFREIISDHLKKDDDIKSQVLINTLCAEFGISERSLDFNHVHTKNSGVWDIAIDIDVEINTFEETYCGNSDLHNWVYLTPEQMRSFSRNFESDKRKMIYKMADKKYTIFNKTTSIIKEGSKFDQNTLEKNLLEQLGFVPCSHCIVHNSSLTLKPLKNEIQKQSNNNNDIPF